MFLITNLKRILPEKCLNYFLTTGRPSHGIHTTWKSASHNVPTPLALVFTIVSKTQTIKKSKQREGMK